MFQHEKLLKVTYVLSILVIVFFLFCLTVYIEFSRFRISTEKSQDENAPVSISPGEEIEISIICMKSDRFSIPVYWDEDEENCVKLSYHFFISKGTITAPTEKGKHTLVIKNYFLWPATRFYYVVE